MSLAGSLVNRLRVTVNRNLPRYSTAAERLTYTVTATNLTKRRLKLGSRFRRACRILLGHNQLKPLIHMGLRAFLNFMMYGYILEGRLENVEFKGRDTKFTCVANYINFKH